MAVLVIGRVRGTLDTLDWRTSMTAEGFVTGSHRWLLSTGGSLRERTLRGGVWLVLSDVLSQGIGLIRAVILSRLLAPDDFGLFGIALLVQRWIEAFTETGVTAALVQKKGPIDRYLGTALWMQFGRAAAIALAVVLFAPWAGAFFRNQNAPAMVRCLALSTALWAFTNPAVVCLRRELHFKLDVIWRFSNVFVSFVVAVVASLLLRNAWGLAIGLVAGQGFQALASYLVLPARPRLTFEWDRARELMRFGRWITATNMLAFLDAQIDSLAAGRFLGATALGYYQVAAQFTNPAVRVGTLLNGLLFPALCQVEDNASRRNVLACAVGFVSLVLVPAGFLFQTLAPPALLAILGSKWAISASVVGILVWSAIFRALSACATSLLLSAGKPRATFSGQCLKVGLMITLGYWMMRSYGIRGIAIAAGISAAAALAQQLVLAAKATGLPFIAIVSEFRDASLAALPAAVALLACHWSEPAGCALAGVVALPCYVWLTLRRLRPLLAHGRPLHTMESVEVANE